MADTTKQRLIDTGLFTESGSAEDHGAHLTFNDRGAVLGGEVSVFAKVVMRFNSSGDLTNVAVQISQKETP